MLTVVIFVGLAIIVLITYFASTSRNTGNSGTGELHAADNQKLTRIVKRFLDVAWYFLVVTAILWPIMAIGIGFNVFFDPDVRNVDVFLGFRIYPDTLPDVTTDSVSAMSEIIRGRSKLQINTPSQFVWILSAVVSEILLVIVLYGLAKMRALFASLISGGPFTAENAERIKKIGFVVIGLQLLIPLTQYFGGRAMLNDIELSVQGLLLYPAFEINIIGVFVGLAIIVLSGLLREAADIQEDQSLTI